MQSLPSRVTSFQTVLVGMLTLTLTWSCSSTPSGDAAKTAEPVAPGATAANAAAPINNTNAATAANATTGEPDIDAVMASVDNQVEDDDVADEENAAPVGDEISHATTQKIPLEINSEVERWLDFFTAKDRERFQRFMERGEKYRPAIMAILREQGIPTEIYYQAMIESGFACSATSRARAVGIWQFVKETGRRYGLRVDNYVDERRDPLRSTIAASLYMKDLYNVFQSWYLAMAAYNAGERRIMTTIMKAKTRDFWAMVKTHALPAETMNYIPKFLAATTIGHDPGKYGFDEMNPEMMPQLVSVSVPSPVKLADIARAAHISPTALHEYNPQLLRGMTPPGSSTYRIWVPREQAGEIEQEREHLAALRVKGLRAVVVEADSPRSRRGRHHRLTAHAEAVAMKHYKVKRGDNLDAIAHRFGLSVNDLKKLNRLRHNRVYVGQVLKVGEEKG